MMLKKYFYPLFRLGTSKVNTYEDFKIIEFSNQICVFYILLTSIYCCILFAIKLYLVIWIALVTILGFSYALWLNKWGYFKTSKCIIVINSVISIYLAAIITGKVVAGQFFLVFVVPLVVLFFKNDNNWLRRGCLSLPLVAFIVLELTNYATFYQAQLAVPIVTLLYQSVFFVICLILFFMFKVYIHLFQHAQNNMKHLMNIFALTEREVEIIAIIVKGKTNKSLLYLK